MIQEENTNYYSTPDTVKHYSASYELRPDERWIVDNVFRGNDILVVGCGTGRTVLPLDKMGYAVTGIDISLPMIEEARQNFVQNSVFVYGDATDMNYDQKFDTVFFPFHSLDYMEQRKEVLVRAKAALKPGGVLIYNTHNRFFLKRFFRYLVSPIKPYVKDIVPHGYVLSYYSNPYKEGGTRIWRNSINYKIPKWKRFIFSICPPLFNKSCYIIIK